MIPRPSVWCAALALGTAIVTPVSTMAYQQAFEQTPAGEVKVQTLPAGRWLVAEASGSYFERSGTLFSRLFNYIRSNDIEMTVPVEGALDHAQMRFYVGEKVDTALTDSESVRVVDTPARRVVSLGGSGSYSESNIREARQRLEAWLSDHDNWTAIGEPYAVFWNGPFTPWFMKRFEIHVPVGPARRN